jgi:hypothetical protein
MLLQVDALDHQPNSLPTALIAITVAKPVLAGRTLAKNTPSLAGAVPLDMGFCARFCFFCVRRATPRRSPDDFPFAPTGC